MKISIILLTFNHSFYIRQCMESICMQQTSYETELIVADDCSRDDTLSIIQEYVSETAFNMVLLPARENIGMVKNYQKAFSAVKGEYVAVIEGDDYWSDPGRLQKHVDFLDQHDDCVMSMNLYTVLDQPTRNFKVPIWDRTEGYFFYTTADMALSNRLGNLSACVFRKMGLDKMKPDLFDLKIADWMLGMVLGEYGKIAILGEVMSVYRVHQQGQWSKMDKEEQLSLMIELINTYNKYLGFRYDKEFKLHKAKLLKDQITNTNNRFSFAYLLKKARSLMKRFLPGYARR